MARPIRLEIGGALYPVMTRGDHREAIAKASPDQDTAQTGRMGDR